MPAAAAVAITHCGLLAGTPPAAHGRASAFVAPVPAGGLAAAARRGVVFPLGDARPMPAVVSGCHRHSRAVAPRVPPSRRSVVGPVMALDNPPAALRELLTSPTCLLMPCAYDALSARLVARAGFPLTFMSGFSVAASLGLPDTGLLGYAEVEARLRSMTTAVDIPIICDADTGYGGVANVVRTVRGLAAAGAAGLMLEDQVWPKRCGHTKGKAVVDRETAFLRVKAAVDASRSLGDRYAASGVETREGEGGVAASDRREEILCAVVNWRPAGLPCSSERCWIPLCFCSSSAVLTCYLSFLFFFFFVPRACGFCCPHPDGALSPLLSGSSPPPPCTADPSLLRVLMPRASPWTRPSRACASLPRPVQR